MIIAAVALSLLAQPEYAPEDWYEISSEHGLILSLGEPENAMIRFRCIRRGVLRAYLAGFYTGEGPEPRRVEIRSLRDGATYRLAYGADAVGGFSAEIPVTARVMSSFRRSGRLSFRVANVRVEGGGPETEQTALIASYFARCRGL